MVWSSANVTPPVLTVTVLLPPASAIASGFADTLSVAASSSVIVTVSCAVCPPYVAVISTVSPSSSIASSIARNVSVAVLCPAVSVSDAGGAA